MFDSASRRWLVTKPVAALRASACPLSDDDESALANAKPGQRVRHHGNNFDAIRIVAALAVLVSHAFALAGKAEPSFFGLHSLGGGAVLVFFVISGYLVTMSWWRDPSVWRFTARRILRIWPALTVVVVVTTYGLGALVTTLPLWDYWSHRATFDYLSALYMRVYFVLPGVFEDNPYPRSVNGSLWTIPLEVRCYVVLAAAGLLCLLRWKAVWLGVIAVLMFWFFIRFDADVTGKVHHGAELSAFFLAGSALFVLEPLWRRHPWHWLFALGAAAVLAWVLGARYTASWILLPYFVILAGTHATPYISRAARFGDPSYGTYLIAFPVEQTLVHFFWPRIGLWGLIPSATIITLALAYASWYGVEKVALRFKPRRPR